jgi:hypothetical protein
MFIFKDKKIKDLSWFPIFPAPKFKTAKKGKEPATKPESVFYSDLDKHFVKFGFVPFGRSLTVPKKHDSFFAMIRSILKEKMKKEPLYHWRELVKLPCDPKQAELAIKLDIVGRKIRVTGKNPSERQVQI